MRRIPATQGYEIICDDADYELLASFNWHARTDGKYGARRPGRNLRINGRLHVIFVHHELLGRPPQGIVIDHINGNAWDNRRNNLRFCTIAQNTQNRAWRKSNGLAKGVSKTTSGRFHVEIAANKQRYYVGLRSTSLAAELAYDSAALFLHGPFARLNRPEYATLPCDPLLLREASIRRRQLGNDPSRHSPEIFEPATPRPRGGSLPGARLEAGAGDFVAGPVHEGSK